MADVESWEVKAEAVMLVIIGCEVCDITQKPHLRSQNNIAQLMLVINKRTDIILPAILAFRKIVE